MDLGECINMNEKTQYQRDREVKEFLIKAMFGLLAIGILSWCIGLYISNPFFIIIGIGFTTFALIINVFLAVI